MTASSIPQVKFSAFSTQIAPTAENCAYQGRLLWRCPGLEVSGDYTTQPWSRPDEGNAGARQAMCQLKSRDLYVDLG
jgi:hypothetical protein